MELADNIEESADDITAADIAPSPTNDTAGGTKYCKDIGRIFWASGLVPFNGVCSNTASQSVQGNTLMI